jgi:hypothetical protein
LKLLRGLPRALSTDPASVLEQQSIGVSTLQLPQYHCKGELCKATAVPFFAALSVIFHQMKMGSFNPHNSTQWFFDIFRRRHTSTDVSDASLSILLVNFHFRSLPFAMREIEYWVVASARFTFAKEFQLLFSPFPLLHKGHTA